MNDYGTILRRGILTRYYKESKYWYIESLPMGTKDKLGFDWGVYEQLHKPPTEVGLLAKTGRLQVT